MSSPWEVLGVQPGCSPAELKAAYARLLKQHRPDVDPAGFRRIRDAYEYLRSQGTSATDPETFDLAPIRRREPPAGKPPESPATPPDTAPHAPPLALRRHRPPAAARLRRALHQATLGTPTGSLARLHRALLRLWRHGDAPATVWSELLHSELERDAAAVRKLLKPADALRAARAGDTQLPRRLLMAHLADQDVDAADKLAQAMVGACSRRPGIELAIAATGFATELALFDPAAAERIANLAFPLLEGDARQDTAELDCLLRAGAEVAKLPAIDRLCLYALLRLPRHLADADDIQPALRILRQSATKAPILIGLLSTRFPDLRDEFALLQGGRKPKPRRVRPASTESSIPWGWIVVAFVLLRLLLKIERAN